MPVYKDIMYRYDGSFEGFLSCVFESYQKKEIPSNVLTEDSAQSMLYPEVWIDTDSAKAQRVFRSLQQKISLDAAEMVQVGFLTCAKNKELLLLHFIRLCYQFGPEITNHLTNQTVLTLNKAILHLRNEEQRIKGFLHFYEYEGNLIAEIEPKNFLLPVIANHFCSRYPEEHLCIHDLTHHVVLLYHPYEAELFPVEHFSLPHLASEEIKIENLWKRFVETIAVEGRINPRCQMNMMPKRYWRCMIEHRGRLSPSP